MTTKCFKSMLLASMAITVGRLVAFDPGKAGWKMDGDKLAVDAKGNPVWVDANGGENAMDGGAIARLNGEARTLRQRAETAEAALKPFEGLDAAVARKAIEDIGKIDTKKLIDAGEVDRVRAEIGATYQGRIDEATKKNGELQGRIDDMTIGGVFTNSDFIRDNVAMPREFFESAFRKNFQMKDGKVTAFHADGNPVYSVKTPGGYAEPEEALSILVDSHPQKAAILKAPEHRGSGNNGSGGNRSAMRTLNRAQFAALAPNEQATYSADVRSGKAALVD